MLLKLRQWRQYIGVSQRKLAATAGFGDATIKRLEDRDEPDNGRPATRRKLAQALGISPTEIAYLPPGFQATPED